MFYIDNVMGQEVETSARGGLKLRGWVTATSCDEGGKVYIYIMNARGHVECCHIDNVRFLQRWDPEAKQFVPTTHESD